MTTDVGAIKYTVEAETGDLLNAEKVVDKTTTAMANDFNKVDKAAARTGTQLTKTSKAVTTGLASMGRGAGQAGIQVQQFIGQVQGGQGVMLALSQQAADLGFVLGAPLLGAVVGISASLAGMLLPNLFKTTEGIIDLDESIEKLVKSYDKLGEAQQDVAKTVIVEKIKEQKKEARGLQLEINKLQTALINAERSQNGRFFERILGEDPAEVRKELAKVKGSLVAVNLSIEENTTKLKGLDGQSEKYKETIKDIVSGLKGQIIALEEGEQASFRYAVAQQLNLKVGEQIPESIDAQIDALFRLKDAKDAEAKADQERKRKEAEERSKKGKAQAFAEGVSKSGLSEEEQLQAKADQLIRDKELVDLETFEKAKTAIEKQQADLRKKRKDEEIRNDQIRNNMILASSANLFASMADLLKSSEKEQSSAYRAMFAISKAFAIAQASMNLSTAISQASTLPYPANIPAMAAAASSGASLVSAISGANISGGRQYGGPVTQGNNYRINEGGVPEVLSSGGKDYLMNSPNGNVKQLDEVSGSGVTVNVNNMASGVEVEATPSDDGRIIDISVRRSLEALTEQINTGNGSVMRAFKSNTNMTTKASS